jgi:hypothetical protein
VFDAAKNSLIQVVLIVQIQQKADADTNDGAEDYRADQNNNCFNHAHLPGFRLAIKGRLRVPH